jgi:putative (di)nucleoside polyphosphate hydrolase
MPEPDVAALPYRRGVGLVVANCEGLIFAGQRIDNPGDAWQMPQGGIDPGETPLRAAFRELEEETGIPDRAVELVAETPGWLRYDLPRALVPRIWGGRYRGQEQMWFLFRFSGPDTLVDIAREHPEFSRWAWMEPAALIERIVPFKRDLYRDVFRVLGQHLEPCASRGGGRI